MRGVSRGAHRSEALIDQNAIAHLRNPSHAAETTSYQTSLPPWGPGIILLTVLDNLAFLQFARAFPQFRLGAKPPRPADRWAN